MVKWFGAIVLLAVRLAPDGRDVLWLAGLALLSYGVGQVYPPLAYVVSGVVLLYLALWHQRGSTPTTPATRAEGT